MTAVLLAALALAAPATARPTYLPCSTSHGAGGLVSQLRPSHCLTGSPTSSLAETADLRNLHWRRWGALAAYANGTAHDAPHLGNPARDHAVNVIADRWEYDCAGRRYYSRLRIRTGTFTGAVWLAPGCVYPEYRIAFRDKIREYLANGAAPVRVYSDTRCDFGAPGLWRCGTTAEASDGCIYDVRGHFDRGYRITIDRATPTAANTLDCGPPSDTPGAPPSP